MLSAENGPTALIAGLLAVQPALYVTAEVTLSAGVAYTIATGRLFATMPDFHQAAERLLDRPILTHEFAFSETWDQLRAALETELAEAVLATKGTEPSVPD